MRLSELPQSSPVVFPEGVRLFEPMTLTGKLKHPVTLCLRHLRGERLFEGALMTFSACERCMQETNVAWLESLAAADRLIEV